MRKSFATSVFGIVVCAAIAAPNAARADEGGVSFWVPGFLGSLAAAPATPGFAFTSIGYHTSIKAGSDVAFARQVHRGNISANFTGNLSVDLRGDANLYIGIPSYTFEQRFMGAQAQILMLVPYGQRMKASVDATLSGNFGLGGPGFSVSGGRSDEISGFGDIVPQANLRWNNGVHNYMVYATGNILTGRYDPDRLANLGIGHHAIDGGGAYTYFNPQTGYEFSGTLGFTYNFENKDTLYKNGVDMHFDWGASKFLSQQFHIGAVGYAYTQLSCDSGVGDRVGCFESRVFAAGPQVGYIMPLGEHHQGYFNLKGYKEFGAEHRPEGWNVWLTFAISSAAPTGTPPTAQIIRK